MGDGGHRLTTPMAFAHMVKAVMGAGSFALPWAFTQSGVMLGPLLLLTTAALSVWTHIMLARVRRRASSYIAYRDFSENSHLQMESGGMPASSERKGSPRESVLLSYISTAQAILGPGGGTAAFACTLFASIGVCSAYIVFITDNMCSILEGRCKDPMQRAGVTSIAVVGLIVLSWLRDLRKLAFTSALGDLAILFGGCMVMWTALFHPSPASLDPSQPPIPGFIFSSLPLAFGTIAFLFCTQFLSLPIEGSMANPEEWPYAVGAAFSCCAVFNSLFGVMGCYAWGYNVKPIVILNVPDGSISNLVKVCLSLDLFLTFPIVIYPSIEMVESNELVKAWLPTPGSRDNLRAKNILRACLVALTAIIAHAVPHFGLLTDLFGGFGQTLLAFVIPPLMYMNINKKFDQPLMWAVCAYGATSCIFTVGMSLVQLSEKMQQGQ